MHKKLRSESGASAVEFALLLPVLMMILFGIIEFGLALYRQAILTNASREGARLRRRPLSFQRLGRSR